MNTGMTNVIQQCEANEDQAKERVSNVTATTENEDLDILRTSDGNLEVEIYRTELFRLVSMKKLSSNVNRSAVSWIQTTCFIKNFDLETTLLSVTLYYCYIHHLPVTKPQLELILLSCVYLASKFTGFPMSLEEGMKMTSKNFSRTEIIETQSQLLTIVEFDLFFSNTLNSLNPAEHTEQNLCRIHFLTQILLLKDEKVLFSEQSFKNLKQLVEDPTSPVAQRKEVLELLRSKNSEILKNKYKSQFNIDIFIDQLTNDDQL